MDVIIKLFVFVMLFVYGCSAKQKTPYLAVNIPDKKEADITILSSENENKLKEENYVAWVKYHISLLDNRDFMTRQGSTETLISERYDDIKNILTEEGSEETKLRIRLIRREGEFYYWWQRYPYPHYFENWRENIIEQPPK